jgi:HAD superfamily hydrolase (TIGR01509 family)
MIYMKDKQKFELIIFDMDGLMFDTEKISFVSWRDAAARYGYQINDEIFRKTIGTNLINTKNIYLKHFGNSFPIEEIISERVKITEEIIRLNGVPIKKGLYDLLNYLSQNNIKKAVATSTSRNRALNLLKLTSVDSHFDYVLCGDEIEKSKPDPEIFLKVADKLGCSPNQCLILEDSEAGIEAAYKAGMFPIMIPDMKEPNELIQKLIFKKMDSLLDVKYFLKELFGTSSIA